jgi:rare lipoprotein A
MASWYGRPFHGRTTASGEIYDMYQSTAAHLTAPLGTYALVTNLNNGQSIRVRINDRGPYKRRRILDLSYEAARQLDLIRAGSGRVQIEFLPESAALDLPPAPPALTLVEPIPYQRDAGAALILPPTFIPIDTSPDQRNAVQVIETLRPPPFAVPVGAYQNHHNAMRAHPTLTTLYQNVWISMAPEGTQPLHRVRLGPFNNRDEAERVVHKVKNRGYTALIVAMAR